MNYFRFTELAMLFAAGGIVGMLAEQDVRLSIVAGAGAAAVVFFCAFAFSLLDTR